MSGYNQMPAEGQRRATVLSVSCASTRAWAMGEEVERSESHISGARSLPAQQC